MQRRSNRAKVRKKFEKAFKHTVDAFYDKNDEILREPRYWVGFENSITHRQNGETVVGAFRNIQDTGDLANSMRTVIQPGKGLATFSWGSTGDTPAQEVYFGKRTPTSYIPGRQWDKVALSEIDLPSIFASYLRQ